MTEVVLEHLSKLYLRHLFIPFNHTDNTYARYDK